MPRHAISFGIALRNFSNFRMTLVQLITLSLIIIPLAGCGADGQGGPVLSSLSTPTDPPSGEGVPPASGSAEAEATGGEDQTASEQTTPSDATAGEAEVLDTAADIAEPGDGEEDPTISVTSTPTGATAKLTWDASADPSVSSYYAIMESNHPESQVLVPMKPANQLRLHQPPLPDLSLTRSIFLQLVHSASRKAPAQVKCLWSRPPFKAEHTARRVVPTSELPWFVPGEFISSLTSTQPIC
ncbi:MAG: hypothetical protein QM706_16335 [Nitrospira sp.]